MIAECLYQMQSHQYSIQLQLFNYKVPTMAFARTAVHQTLAQQHQIHNRTAFIVANIALTGSWPCSSPTRHINKCKSLFYFIETTRDDISFVTYTYLLNTRMNILRSELHPQTIMPSRKRSSKIYAPSKQEPQCKSLYSQVEYTGCQISMLDVNNFQENALADSQPCYLVSITWQLLEKRPQNPADAE